MKTYFFFAMVAIVLTYIAFVTWRRRPSTNFRSVDAIIPAYNEGPVLETSLRNLIANPYFRKVIVVDDGSKDETYAIALRLQAEFPDRVLALTQANTGKGGALMHGIAHATCDQVFLTDADTYVPPDESIGYMLAEIEAGADAVGGIPSSNLNGAGWLPHIRATVKLPMIILKRTFQQMLGGAPFIISGSCGMFKTQLLREFPFSDRTKVEDLDLTWTLVKAGKKIRQANRCIVYPQECNTLREEYRRWRRWIVGFAVCMRLHSDLLFTRFGLFSIMPMFLLVVLGVAIYALSWAKTLPSVGPLGIAYSLFPLLWVAVVMVIGVISAIYHRKPFLPLLAPLAVGYVLMAYAIWIVHGIAGLITGREPNRDKPTRYAYNVAR